MRLSACALALAIALATSPALAQADRAADKFWKSVQATCDTTAAKPAGELGQRIAQTAIDEFNRFGGHQIDANGRLFRFGLTEAEHEEDDGGAQQATIGHLGWWQVMKYWQALYGNDAAGKLEARGYSDASTATQEAQEAALLRTDAARLLREAENVSDPAAREILREAALRAAIIDTSWSAAFVSYVVKQSGATESAFRFANAHRAYIYDAFATSAAEQNKETDNHIYRACPLLATRPRIGDLICNQRESALADASEAAVRERIRAELASGGDTRTIRRTHCEVVASVDPRTRTMVTIGGNVLQAVTARKLHLRKGSLKFQTAQKGHCGADRWALAKTAAQAPHGPAKCSLNDKKWFVLLQVR
ncbi:MAG: DUF2272 domain-containing protein [Xanthobacteraceae bacterium]|nr:DUF2272 domain-containing protein [Xanthobacteraceae bacterium]